MDTKAKAFITEWPEKSHKSYLDLISTTIQQILNDSALSPKILLFALSHKTLKFYSYQFPLSFLSSSQAWPLYHIIFKCIIQIRISSSYYGDQYSSNP